METLLTHANSLDLFRIVHASHPMLPVFSFANTVTVVEAASARGGLRNPAFTMIALALRPIPVPNAPHGPCHAARRNGGYSSVTSAKA